MMRLPRHLLIAGIALITALLLYPTGSPKPALAAGPVDQEHTGPRQRPAAIPVVKAPVFAPAALALPPHLNLTAAVSPAPAVPSGLPVTWTFMVASVGFFPSPGTTFSATLPAGLRVSPPTTAPPAAQPCTLTNAGQRASCALGTLAVGQSVTITITATMLFVPLGTNLCATGQVSGGPAGGTVTRQAQACTRLVPPAPYDLVSGLTCARSTLARGESTTCTLTVTNTGPQAASIPGGALLAHVHLFSFQGTFGVKYGATAAPPGYPNCTLHGLINPFQCAAPAAGDSLAAGASRVWTLTVTYACDNGCPGGTLILSSTADWDARIPERNENNNSALVTLTIAGS
jgi:hypothetical protein